jgi:hypothetical protein
VAVITEPLDKESKDILKKLLANPYGINKSQLWQSDPVIEISKEPYLKRLSKLKKAGAIEFTRIGNQEIVTPVPEIVNKILAENKLTLYIPTDSGEEKQKLLVEEEEENQKKLIVKPLEPDIIPAWFRIERTIMEKIEKMVSEGETSNSKDKKRLAEFMVWLDQAICSNSLFVTAKMCSGKYGPWDYVSREIMKGTGDERDVLLFLLYEVRTALLLKCYRYLQAKEQRVEMEPPRWVELVNAFFHRWERITYSTRYSGSLEERLPNDVFSGFVLKEDDLDPSDGEEYILLTYEAIKWHSLTRNVQTNHLFEREYQKALDAYEERGRRLLNKANQHKQYRIGRHTSSHWSTWFPKKSRE